MKLDDYYKTTNFELEMPNKTPIILNVIQLCYETMFYKTFNLTDKMKL